MIFLGILTNMCLKHQSNESMNYWQDVFRTAQTTPGPINIETTETQNENSFKLKLNYQFLRLPLVKTVVVAAAAKGLLS